jgi:hypothetical protein
MASKNIMSEKYLEAKLREAVKKAGGWCIKIPAVCVIGIPDRLILMPIAKAYFAEIKTTGKKPEPVQLVVHAKLRKLGFDVFIIDSNETLKTCLQSITSTPTN